MAVLPILGGNYNKSGGLILSYFKTYYESCRNHLCDIAVSIRRWIIEPKQFKSRPKHRRSINLKSMPSCLMLSVGPELQLFDYFSTLKRLMHFFPALMIFYGKVAGIQFFSSSLCH